MPIVLRRDGFRVVIYLPPRDHEPPHVHVWHAGGEVVIDLASRSAPQSIRAAVGMRASDITRAFWLVEEHHAFLLDCWRTYHD